MMRKYLAPSRYIDWQSSNVLVQAGRLALGRTAKVDVARACFEFVRDEIKHSGDYELNPVTCEASDVFRHGTGFCYAKSHLLAALLRANDIPAGLCYQRLTIENDSPPFCLHGLNAVFLEPYGWYRVDARGDKEGVETEFSPPVQKLAYPIMAEGEADLPEIWSEPLEVVTRVLETSKTYLEVADNLPDVELFGAGK